MTTRYQGRNVKPSLRLVIALRRAVPPSCRRDAFAALVVAFAATATLWATSDPAPDTTPRVPASISFANHVVPVLTKMGCNSGACHGAAAGKNGFALTLRGYDPAADYDAITRQAGGRRVNLIEPAKSLLLLKPTEVVPHVGGRKFTPGTAAYDVLAGWLASGARGPSAADARLASLEVTPDDATLGAGDITALTVTARFSNGVAEDVTSWAKFASADETVAHVDEQGRVTVKGPGETAVSVSFLTGVAMTRVRSPFAAAIPESAYTSAARHNLIDDHVLVKLRQMRVAPSPLSSDHVFIRRAFLDAAGILPTRAEVEAFVADPAPDKRARLIERLLARDEFVDYWTYKWSDVLLVSSRSLGRNNMRAFYGWIRGHVAANTPWDRLVRELLTATGRSSENGATNYFLIHRSPIELAENSTQAFLGLTLTCARCHNHPMEKWTQTDYYGFANLFARVAMKEDGVGGAKGDAATVFSVSEGDILHPRLGVAMPPRPLDGVPMASHDTTDRRAYLAAWLTSPDNTPFARTVVNRVWANYFGRGLVHPVDDLRFTNAASNEPLFDAVTAEFIRGGFDLRSLMRLIMNSAAYQRSAETVDGNARDDRFFSRYLTRRLPAEVILDAFSQVTSVPQDFGGYPRGTRAMQLPDTRVNSYFLSVFGRPERVTTSAAERMQDPTLPQALHTINGETLNEKLLDDRGRLARMVEAGQSNAEVLEELYWSALSRPPSPRERTAILAVLDRTPGGDPGARRRGLEDLAWAVLTSTEFLFTH
jgi:hypothetical protein